MVPGGFWIDPLGIWIDPDSSVRADFWPNFAGTPRLRPNSEWGDSWTVGKIYESTFKPNWPHIHNPCICRDMCFLLSACRIFLRFITPFSCSIAPGPHWSFQSFLNWPLSVGNLSWCISCFVLIVLVSHALGHVLTWPSPTHFEFLNKDDCVNILDTCERVLWYVNWLWALSWTYELINGNVNVNYVTRGPKGYARSDTGPLWYARSDTGPIWHARRINECLKGIRCIW